jgi:hypothetical protein
MNTLQAPWWAVPIEGEVRAVALAAAPRNALQGPFLSPMTANLWIAEMEHAEYIRGQWCLAALGAALLLVGVVVL